jgi:hypothetical protein
MICFLKPCLFLDNYILTEKILSVNFFCLYGAVAQMGEHMTGSHEVRGSIPLSSTTYNLFFKDVSYFFPFFFFRYILLLLFFLYIAVQKRQQ